MNIKSLIRWDGFKKLDLSEWESCKKNDAGIPGVEYSLPNLGHEYDYDDEIIDKIEDLYHRIYECSNFKAAKEIKNNSQYVYKLLKKAFVIERKSCKEEYNNSEREYSDDHVFNWSYTNLLYIVHTEIYNKRINNYEDYFTLSLMLIDASLKTNSKDRFLLLFESFDVFHEGNEKLEIVKEKKEAAKKRANIKNRKNHYLRLISVIRANTMQKKHPSYSLRKISQSVSEEICEEAKNIKYPYSKERFNQTIYGWILDANKTGCSQYIGKIIESKGKDINKYEMYDISKNFSWIINGIEASKEFI